MFPKDFEDRMRKLLGAEYDAFEESMQGERYHALRLNPLKVNREEFLEKSPFQLTDVVWEKNGFYYESQDTPGKHPYHEAGVYYIQEPSAMAPAGYLEVKPNEKVLDLCAAPGGKSTQLAVQMNGEGIFVCNEIHPARAKILSENVERMGIRNAIVLNETPEHLAECFVEYFDKILVDAPCSGEGMFRKNEIATTEWSLENVEICARRQDGILDCAADMLAAGGRLVYSTCTFAPQENEGSISRFLMRHPEFSIVKTDKCEGMTVGNADWTEDAADGIEETIRLFPHHLKGEGHYLAVLEKSGAGQNNAYRGGIQKGLAEKDCQNYMDFAKEHLKKMPEGIYVNFGEQLYLLPKDAPSLKGLKVLRAGLHLGTNKKMRFEPSHALALALKPEEVTYTVDFPADSPEIYGYLNGMTINGQGEKGWYLITAGGYSIGWAKMAGGIFKNHYPKGLRKNLN